MGDSRVAVVTGGNKGIGLAIVRGLCSKFPGIVYLTARDVQRGESAVEQLKKEGITPKFRQLDITDTVSIGAFHDFIKAEHGGIDILVNNAAIAYKHVDPAPFSEQAEVTIKVNYFATLDVCNQLFPLLRPGARVVNLSSSCGQLSNIKSEDLKARLKSDTLTISELSTLMNQFVAEAKAGTNVESGWGGSAYNVSKVGVTALTRIQQRQFNSEPLKQDIIVTAVHPGYVDTDMTSHKGPLTPDQGARAPLKCALLPPGSDEYKGAYVWEDGNITEWK